MNHLRNLPTHPALNAFLKISLTDRGELITKEVPEQPKQHKVSACCFQETYQMGNRTHCGFCGQEADVY